MKRVLLVQPSLNPPGGGNAVAAWTVQALRDTYRVDVLTWEPIVLDAMNRHYGTSLQPGDFVAHRVTPLLGWLTPRHGLALWKHTQLLRIARAMVVPGDVVIGMNNESDLGPRGVQYVHFPRYHDPRINRRGTLPRDPGTLRWYHRSPRLMTAYFRACALASGYSVERMRATLTLVNSDWTGGFFKRTHGMDTLTVYPPVAADFPDIPWQHREHGFVCVGRIAPEKRLAMVITILAAVRQRGHDVTLRIIGVPDDAESYREVRRLQAQHADWVSLHLDVQRASLTQLVASQQYGIHAMRDEHFGIAVGEMVNAGCIVFVPSEGGQVEIIGEYPDLLYSAPDEAVNKIDAVLRDPVRQAAARAHLANRRLCFSTAAFMSQMRSIVERFD